MMRLPDLTPQELRWLNAFEESWLAAMRSSDTFKTVVPFSSNDGCINIYLQETVLDEGDVIYTVPNEGYGNLPNKIYRLLVGQQPSHFMLTYDKPESIVHTHKPISEASNSQFRAASVFRRYDELVKVTSYDNAHDFNADCQMLYAENMKRFSNIYPFYPYWHNAYACPFQEHLAMRLEEEAGFAAEAHRIDGELVAIVCSSVADNSIMWERTLRTFDPRFEKLKVGLCSTLYLMQQEYKSGYPIVNLGLTMPYKQREYASNSFWTYSQVQNINLRMKQ